MKKTLMAVACAAAAVCLQEVAVVPVLGDWVGDHTNNCSNGNVIDHSGR